MKRIISLLLCILVFGSLLLPVSAAIFQVSYYEEEIYAGGIMVGSQKRPSKLA